MFEELFEGLEMKRLENELTGAVTDGFLQILLRCMDLAFNLDFHLSPFKGYKQNIEGFNACYVFRTKDHLVGATAVFEDDDMKVINRPFTDQWNARVTFNNAQAFKDFLFSGEPDIVNSLLENQVEVDGNLNYIYKFGFMASDLGHRLGIH